jgi:glycosyltransferase involved in cell wall biosynthesis
LHEIAAARTHAACVIATTHASSLGFLCQRGTLMWHGQTLCDGLVDPVRCAACELEHRGVVPDAAAGLARIPATFSRAARALPFRAGTALAMRDLIAYNQERQRRMFALLDRFVVLTRRAAEIVLANGAPADRVSVNRLGVSQEPAVNRSEPRRPASSPIRVGYVGRFDAVKGVYELAGALRLLADIPLRCEFRGPANSAIDRATRDALRRALDGDARVTFGDAVPTKAMPSLLASYDIVCCPSRCLEGGPTVALEAMAAGTPVIAADAGGIAEVIEDGVNGRLVPPGDTSALADALREITRDPAGTIEMWRGRLPPARTMREVAADYLSLYAGAA